MSFHVIYHNTSDMQIMSGVRLSVMAEVDLLGMCCTQTMRTVDIGSQYIDMIVCRALHV